MNLPESLKHPNMPRAIWPTSRIDLIGAFSSIVRCEAGAQSPVVQSVTQPQALVKDV